jgi:hypothetical protein
MAKKLNIRESLYLEDLKRASKLGLLKKLKLSLELSDFCRYLQSKTLKRKR